MRPPSWSTRVGSRHGPRLARIHSATCASAESFLLKANEEAIWFLNNRTFPASMQDHTDGTRVWQAVHDLKPYLVPVNPVLVHLDYWRGNLLWEDGQISAVVDWEEAAFGDPAVDVGYCRMELAIMGITEEAEEFVRVYQD